MMYKMMNWNEHLVLAASIIALITVIHALKKRYYEYIYGLWYLYFVSFAILLVLTFGVHYASEFFAGNFGKTAKALSEEIINYTYDFRSEIIIVFCLGWLGVVPQVLAYLASGLSGSAVMPQFVSSITKLAIWS